MFQKIKKWYELGLWNEAMVRQAVEKGILTPEELTEILGEGTEDES